MRKLRGWTTILLTWPVLAGAAWADVAPGGQGSGYGYGYHPHMGGEWGWGGFFMGPFVGLLFIAAIAVAVVLVVRAVGSGQAPHRHGPSAIDILDERFARGEIDAKEYEERKRVLTAD